jgi:NTE family protein
MEGGILWCMSASAPETAGPAASVQPGSGRRAIVLSGGGARGAYEVGVLSYLYRDLPAKLGCLPTFDIYCGTSVGAVHACHLAANADDPVAGITRLADVWRAMSFSTVYSFGLRDAAGFAQALLGFVRGAAADPEENRDRIAGLLNTKPLENLVVGNIPWRRLRRNVRRGVVSALCVSTTEIATGRTVIFVDTPGRQVPSWTRDPHVVARAALIGPIHPLASAAIPFLFPAVRIGGSYYCDGGLRLHSPLSPALRLGADRVLVLGLSSGKAVEDQKRVARQRLRHFASASFLFGKVLDTIFMDRLEHDLNHMRLLNEIFRAGTLAFGPEFLARVNAVAERDRGLGFRIVDDCYIRPSQDIGEIAGRHVRRVRGSRSGSWLGRATFKTLTRGSPDEEADLMSYLLFDGEYAQELIELGRADAASNEAELARFCSSESAPKVDTASGA